jgi:hypothetical protein
MLNRHSNCLASKAGLVINFLQTLALCREQILPAALDQIGMVWMTLFVQQCILAPDSILSNNYSVLGESPCYQSTTQRKVITANVVRKVKTANVILEKWKRVRQCLSRDAATAFQIWLTTGPKPSQTMVRAHQELHTPFISKATAMSPATGAVTTPTLSVPGPWSFEVARPSGGSTQQ